MFQSRYGRQNPISERWNSTEQLLIWRAAWADAINQELRQRGYENLVDHRSFKDRGLPYHPTIHEGIIAIALERKGITADRCEINRQIRLCNSAIDYWTEAIMELSKVAVLLIADIAKALEMLFADICFNLYVWKVNRRAINNAKSTISENKRVRPIYESNMEKAKVTLLEKKAELKEAKLELNRISVIFKKKRKEAEEKIEILTEEISELESEISATENRIKSNDNNTAYNEKKLSEYEAYEQKLTEGIYSKLDEMEKVKEQAKQFDFEEFLEERMKFRKELEPAVSRKIMDTYGDISMITELEAQRETADLFDDQYATYTDYRNEHNTHKEKDNPERI